MSQPPKLPGQKRLERMASRAGGSAYEGAFEAIGALLISMLAGYWFDRRYETEPAGVLVGAVLGFAAFVLRLVRLGRKLQSQLDSENATVGSSESEEASEAGPTSGAGAEDAVGEDRASRPAP